MAENHPLNLGFQVDSIVAQHAIFALFVDTLSNQIQVKYQPMRVSPFDTHQRVMSTFLAARFIYATTSVAEVILRTQKSVHQRLVSNIRLFASALATILLLDLCQLLCQTTDEVLDMLKQLIATVRSPKEKPNQPNV
ncbi:hypothetical protein H0E87_024184 [Populus deltoides]|uniref:Uncharacterized protein n=1 Tax=Populus deltoides TaxID=3696 RepID=A0A8T2X5P8_POPDE|nr:hypothetical protein H0E87_024184 [Populus deltoides]